MAIIKDLWFGQNDIKKLFDSHSKLKDQWTIVYEKRMSANEHFVYLSIPIAKHHNSIINDYNWGSDDKFTKKRVLHLNGKHFLSVSLRRPYDLYLFGNEYRQKNNPKVYAIIEKSDLGETEIVKCSILTDVLVEYLKNTKQVLLYGIRSHRYSERYLKEYGLRKHQKDFTSNRKNYIYLVQQLSKREKEQRFRANSMSMTFGKYIVHI
ncbi:MAG: hypothetical protein IH852_17295 [Bacteroidetes bacterium]|nr:hypothetical protein [Bacteroidota bacterium]